MGIPWYKRISWTAVVEAILAIFKSKEKPPPEKDDKNG